VRSVYGLIIVNDRVTGIHFDTRPGQAQDIKANTQSYIDNTTGMPVQGGLLSAAPGPKPIFAITSQ